MARMSSLVMMLLLAMALLLAPSLTESQGQPAAAAAGTPPQV